MQIGTCEFQCETFTSRNCELRFGFAFFRAYLYLFCSRWVFSCLPRLQGQFLEKNMKEKHLLDIII